MLGFSTGICAQLWCGQQLCSSPSNIEAGMWPSWQHVLSWVSYLLEAACTGLLWRADTAH